MANPKTSAVVQTALTLLDRVPPIPYVLGGESLAGMDCQGLVEYCVRANGGQMSYAGSNDMIRNACTQVLTLPGAQAQGMLKPGWLLFILKQDGGEPAKYKGDGIGNASHVGLYTGAAKAEVVHASSSNGCVCASTLKNAWTHAGPAKAIDYGIQVENNEEMTTPMYATTYAPSGSTVNMRKTPNGDYMLKIPLGTRLTIYAQNGGWSQTEYSGFRGWVSDEFLRFEEGDAGSGNGDKTDDTQAMRAALERIRAEVDAVLGVG